MGPIRKRNHDNNNVGLKIRRNLRSYPTEFQCHRRNGRPMKASRREAFAFAKAEAAILSLAPRNDVDSTEAPPKIARLRALP